MADQHLTCNALNCNKKLLDTAYVTACSHIYCTDHGQHMTRADKNPITCLVCGTVLPNHYDCILMDLKPTEQYKSIILSGLNPDQIMDIASRGISFFTYQSHFEKQVKDTMLKNVRRQCEETCISISSSYKAEISKLKRFADSLKNELEEKMKDIEFSKQRIVQLARENKKIRAELENSRRDSMFRNKGGTEPPMFADATPDYLAAAPDLPFNKQYSKFNDEFFPKR